MKKNIVILFMFMFSVCALAQGTLKDALDYLPFSELPYDAKKGVPYTNTYGIKNIGGVIPNRLYRNVQCTDYFLADDADTSPVVYGKFKMPGSSNVLLAVSFGGVTDWMTDVLVIVDASGKILDSLEANVWYFPGIPIKQYRIDSGALVIVSVLEPISAESIPLDSFTQFKGNRVDYTYRIVDEKFTLVAKRKFEERVYTKAQLSSRTYNLWDGNEQPVD